MSLGLLHAGRPVAGWVADPLRQERFVARAGRGVTLNGNPLPALPDAVPDADDAMPTGMSTWILRRPQLPAVLDRFGKVRIMGSQALHLAYVAAGRMRAAVNEEAKLWDDAAGALLVTEAGGAYSRIDGRPVFPLSPGDPAWGGGPLGSAAARRGEHADLVERLNRA